MDADGNLYVFHRCSSDTCVDRSEPPLLKFNSSGELLMSWGEGLFVYPHGLDVDHEGNIWVTDARHEGGKGEVVVKFSPEGEVLMTIGTPGVSGDGPYTFDGVSDVAVADNGDIFVADGHLNNRIVNTRRMAHFSRPGARPARGRANSTSRIPSRSIPRDGSSSPIATTTACRSSIRKANSSMPGRSLGVPAGSMCLPTTHCTLPTRNQPRRSTRV